MKKVIVGMNRNFKPVKRCGDCLFCVQINKLCFCSVSGTPIVGSQFYSVLPDCPVLNQKKGGAGRV